MRASRIALFAALAGLLSLGLPASSESVAAQTKQGKGCREGKPGNRPKKCNSDRAKDGSRGDGVFDSTPGAPAAPTTHAVVALIDTGINPYNAAFRDRSPLAQRHPSTYIPNYPTNARTL